MHNLDQAMKLICESIRDNNYSPSAIAAKVFQVEECNVTPKQRDAIKSLAFPFLYGEPF